MDTSELLKKVRRIEIKTKGLSRDLFAGDYHSAFKGRGMSFSEVREYHYGDDVRNIEWNVTARTGIPHVKIFEEERELTVSLIVDISPSTRFGTSGAFRDDLITEICAVIAFSAIQNNDKVSLLLFTDEVEHFIAPAKGKKHILRIIRDLIDHEPNHKGTNLTAALKYFTNLIKKKSICFILSDFYDDSYKAALQVIAKKHDVIGIHIYDPFEKELPRIGLWRFVDAETGRQMMINTSNEQVRRAHKQAFTEHIEKTKSIFSQSGADLISFDTKAPYTNELHQFFKRRMK